MTHIDGLLWVLNILGPVTIGLLGEGSNEIGLEMDRLATYLATMSARSFTFGTPRMKVSIPVMRWRNTDLGFSLSYKYSVIIN